MVMVNMHDAKTKLSKLISLLQQGEEVIIAKAGTPVARLVSYAPKKSRRIPNLLQGKVLYSDDFESADDEIADLFESGEL